MHPLLKIQNVLTLYPAEEVSMRVTRTPSRNLLTGNLAGGNIGATFSQKSSMKAVLMRVNLPVLCSSATTI